MAAGEHRFTLRVGASERHYTVHVPTRHDGVRSLPVVVMLHGGGGTSRAAAYETNWAKKAEQEGFLAVFPDAHSPDPTKPAHFARNPQLWADGSERFYQGQARPDDVTFLDRMLDDLAARFPVDAQRVFLTGFSNGASMTFLAAIRLAPRIAAIAPVAGACWVPVPALNPPVPACYITGTEDPLNPIEGGVPTLRSGAYDPVRAKPKPPVRESIIRWARGNGCPADPQKVNTMPGMRIETYGPGRNSAEVVYVAVDGLGHTWPGGKSLLPEMLVGARSDTLSATDFIWDFFRKHPRPEPGAISP